MKSKVLFFLTVFAFATTSIFAQKWSDAAIDSLIAKMSIEEKVGQMTQIDLGVVAEGGICNLKQPQRIDIAKLQEAIGKYKIGSILNVGCGSGTISGPNWNVIHQTIIKENKKTARLPIPILYGIDAIHGANYTKGATLFPQQIAQAATWNPALVEQANAVSAYETRASGIPWNFSPVLDLGRQPLWSRFFETYGEDVCLASAMARAAIKGLQGDEVSSKYKVAACMKHFLGYSFSLSGKDRTPVWLSEREMRAYFLPTFQEAIATGAKTVMINSGDINGTPVHANYDILTTLLRDELKFKGVAVTDWEDIYKLEQLHRVAATKKEAVRMAIMAGVDMSMVPNDFQFCDLLVELIKEGTVPMSRIDLSVKRILSLKRDLGLFEHPIYAVKDYPAFGSVEHSNLSYQAAAECLTLLKNKNAVLPLVAQKDKILVCGPAAHSLNLLNGAWTHTWQGVDTTTNTPGKKTILQALQEQYGNQLTYAQGASLDALINTEELLSKANSVDKIVVCLGELPSTEVPGNIKSLDLPQAQIQLVKQLASLGKPIILVCCFNRPRIIAPIIPLVDALVYAYLPGDEGGRAIADCITGRINPSGKLPFTYPAASNDIVHYDRKRTEDLDIDFSMNAYQPSFDFGFGLSYTQFTYASINLSADTLKKGSKILVNCKVKNTGARSGAEVLQLYYNDLVASITPSVKKLTAFKKVMLEPNEEKEIQLELTSDSFSFINKNNQRVTEPGLIELMIDQQKKLIYVE
jgi:beta-glucosidase